MWTGNRKPFGGPPSPEVQSIIHKTQLCVPQVTYLGYKLEEGKQMLSCDHILAVLQIPLPSLKKTSVGNPGRGWILLVNGIYRASQGPLCQLQGCAAFGMDRD